MLGVRTDKDYLGHSQSSELLPIGRTCPETTAEAFGIPRAVLEIRVGGPGDSPAGCPAWYPGPHQRDGLSMADLDKVRRLDHRSLLTKYA